MRVLAIDPGNFQSAYVVWDGEEIAEMGIVENGWLLDELRIIINAQDISVVVIEMVASYGMPVGKTIFDTVVMIGELKQICFYWTCEVELVTRSKVKMHHCHSNRAKDSNIRQALVDRFGEVGTKNKPNPRFEKALPEKLAKDKWAAFAIAVYATDGEQDWYKLGQ